MIIQKNPNKLEVENPKEEIKNSELPVLVDCYADWCGPCEMFSPIIEGAAEEYKGKIKVIKVDIDKHEEFSDEYDIRSIPTLLFFSDGQLVKTEIGYKSKSELSGIINEVLGTHGAKKNSEVNVSPENLLLNNTVDQKNINDSKESS